MSGCPIRLLEELDFAAVRLLVQRGEVDLLAVGDAAILDGPQTAHAHAPLSREVHDLARLAASQVLGCHRIALDAHIAADEIDVALTHIRHRRENATSAEHLDLEA